MINLTYSGINSTGQNQVSKSGDMNYRVYNNTNYSDSFDVKNKNSNIAFKKGLTSGGAAAVSAFGGGLYVASIGHSINNSAVTAFGLIVTIFGFVLGIINPIYKK